MRQFAHRLSRSPSTICRELRRDSCTRGRKRTYNTSEAQCQACARRVRPRRCQVYADPVLFKAVGELLATRWSPSQIARRLRRDPPGTRSCGWVARPSTKPSNSPDPQSADRTQDHRSARLGNEHLRRQGRQGRPARAARSRQDAPGDLAREQRDRLRLRRPVRHRRRVVGQALVCTRREPPRGRDAQASPLQPAPHRRGRLHPVGLRRRQPVLTARSPPLRARLDPSYIEHAIGRWGERSPPP